MQQRDDQHSRPQTGENQAPAQARTTTAPRRITPPNAPPHQHHAPEPTRLIRAWHEGLPMRRWIHVCQPSGAGTSGCWLVWVGSDACYWRCAVVRCWAVGLPWCGIGLQLTLCPSTGGCVGRLAAARQRVTVLSSWGLCVCVWGGACVLGLCSACWGRGAAAAASFS